MTWQQPGDKSPTLLFLLENDQYQILSDLPPRSPSHKCRQNNGDCIPCVPSRRSGQPTLPHLQSRGEVASPRRRLAARINETRRGRHTWRKRPTARSEKIHAGWKGLVSRGQDPHLHPSHESRTVRLHFCLQHVETAGEDPVKRQSCDPENLTVPALKAVHISDARSFCGRRQKYFSLTPKDGETKHDSSEVRQSIRRA